MKKTSKDVLHVVEERALSCLGIAISVDRPIKGTCVLLP